MNTENITIQEQFVELMRSGNETSIREFLNDQNISDVAELINELPEYESQIIQHMNMHRAASVFKILDLSTQKAIIQELPPYKTAELLNELPADDRTAFLESTVVGLEPVSGPRSVSFEDLPK